MTQDEIIEMARQIYGTDKWNVGQLKRLEAFAKLVDAKATAREREACAKLADECTICYRNAAETIAIAIRARGEPTSRGEA